MIFIKFKVFFCKLNYIQKTDVLLKKSKQLFFIFDKTYLNSLNICVLKQNKHNITSIT